MQVSPPAALKPRKWPRQARAEATVDAIFEATIQVLLAEGERRLTTTRVAERAGVSVGTMYQYFPHKQALLYAVLQRHLAHVADAVAAACDRGRGRPVAELADLLVGAFLDAKAARLDVTQALYLIAEDLDSTALLAAAVDHNVAAAAGLLASAPDADFASLPTVAFAVFSSIAGSTRVVFERGATPAALQELRRELTLMCRSYLQASLRSARSGW
ncbi:TetR/AcrR family transcriptional regulator [Inquilinus sp. Marseille-Q2685]|uniref:TetR/AcrR family transcriptional regulator n=1 Tax=Inquilinus sp. Marseille-Q2685 TaxID=2866581 RepID=UPI001CE47297|nr:TetR/AcrR family transcriptional regulator [Inquilinus sp. Marseille-Q2685]